MNEQNCIVRNYETSCEQHPYKDFTCPIIGTKEYTAKKMSVRNGMIVNIRTEIVCDKELTGDEIQEAINNFLRKKR